MEFLTKASDYEFKQGEYLVLLLELYSSHRPCPKVGEVTIMGRVVEVMRSYVYIYVEQILKGEYDGLLVKLYRHAENERAYIVTQENVIELKEEKDNVQ